MASSFCRRAASRQRLILWDGLGAQGRVLDFCGLE